LLGERAQRGSATTQSQFKFFGKYDDFDSVNLYGFNRYAKIIAYVGPSVIGQTGPVQLTPIRSPALAEGTVANATFFEAAAGEPRRPNSSPFPTRSGRLCAAVTSIATLSNARPLTS